MTTLQRLLFALGTLLLVEVALSDVVYNIQINPSTTAAMQWNQSVNIAFDYKTQETAGVGKRNLYLSTAIRAACVGEKNDDNEISFPLFRWVRRLSSLVGNRLVLCVG